MIKLTNFSYNNIFSNINFTFEKGVFYNLYNQYHIGKTTFLKILNLDIITYSGKITYFDKYTLKTKNKQIIPLIKNKISFIPQKPVLILEYSIYDNILLFSKLIDSKKSISKKDILNILKNYQLYSVRNKKLIHLDYKYHITLAIALSFLKEPNVLLLDDTFQLIEESLQKLLISKIEELLTKGALVILVSNYPINNLPNLKNFKLEKDIIIED